MSGNKFADKLNSDRKYQTHATLPSVRVSGGRPKKSDEEKLTERVFVNLTKAEKESLEEYMLDKGISSISACFRMMLKEHL